MASTPTTETSQPRAIAAALFEKPPVLVEVRFPACGTSPDWSLCEDEAELDAIFARLVPGAELHLRSVWDLTSRRAPVVLVK